jgi:hypothetical protein
VDVDTRKCRPDASDQAANVRVQVVQHEKRPDRDDVQGADHGDRGAARGEGVVDAGCDLCGGHHLVLDPAPLGVHGPFGGRADGPRVGQDHERVPGPCDLARQPVLGRQRAQPVGRRLRRQHVGDSSVQRHQHVIALREQFVSTHGVPLRLLWTSGCRQPCFLSAANRDPGRAPPCAHDFR